MPGLGILLAGDVRQGEEAEQEAGQEAGSPQRHAAAVRAAAALSLPEPRLAAEG